MIFQVIAPFETTIYGDSFKDAVKNFIKINHNLNITQMIIKDQQRNIKDQIEYYKQDGRNKVGINMFPINSPFSIPIASDTYIPRTVVESVFSPVGLVGPMSPLSPVPFIPFIPTVVNIPNL